uniref:Uncharacterized protein n=1 Tax=Cacopsylla melanoneura TaxID=428564 RepID=A0A8D8RAC8_9HEMI
MRFSQLKPVSVSFSSGRWYLFKIFRTLPSLLSVTNVLCSFFEPFEISKDISELFVWIEDHWSWLLSIKCSFSSVSGKGESSTLIPFLVACSFSLVCPVCELESIFSSVLLDSFDRLLLLTDLFRLPRTLVS